MNDLVLISGLELSTLIGCDPGERACRQTIEMDLEISVAQNSSVLSGNPHDTVCYRSVCESLRALVSAKEWPLLEQLADDSTQMLLGQFQMATQIKLRIRKYVLPDTNWVGIELVRVRR